MDLDPAPVINATMPLDADVRQAMIMLVSLREGDRGITQVVHCGKRAVPALRAVLFGREPGSLYETRRRAVDALAQLGAFDVLIDYLKEPHSTTDPVEAVAQEAIINAAARALAASDDPQVVPVLLSLVRQRPFAGVIDALSKLHQEDALPFFVEALAEDIPRPMAEMAIRAFGEKARQALMEAAIRQLPSSSEESTSSRRGRLSALRLFAELESARVGTWPALPMLLEDSDPRIAHVACRICLANTADHGYVRAIERLIDLLGTADWQLSGDIEDDLVEHFERARGAVEATLQSGPDGGSYYSPATLTRRALRRVMSRVSSEEYKSD